MSNTTNLLNGKLISETIRSLRTNSLEDLGFESEDERNAVLSGYQAIIEALDGNENCVIELDLEEDENTTNWPPRPVDFKDTALANLVEKISEPEIWKDPYWDASPGSNQINIVEYNGRKFAIWTGANWDYVFYYTKYLPPPPPVTVVGKKKQATKFKAIEESDPVVEEDEE